MGAAPELPVKGAALRPPPLPRESLSRDGRPMGWSPPPPLQSAGGGQRGRKQARLLFLVHLARLGARYDVIALHPAVQIDVGAALRAERGELRIARLAADGAGGCLRRFGWRRLGWRIFAHFSRFATHCRCGAIPSPVRSALISASGRPTTLV